MEWLRIEGGRELRGRVSVPGAKNSCLKLMALCIMASSECTITNVPSITDVDTMCDLLRAIGARIVRQRDSVLSVDPGPISCMRLPEHLVRCMRASVQVMGPLLARFGEVHMPYPGGCPIGSRPIDLHLKGLAAMGAQFSEEHGLISGRADRLVGTEIHLDFPSVGATENLMAAACMATGTTVIRNAAREPEIVDQQNFLTRLGAQIRGAGTDTIRITGLPELGSTTYPVMPDRIQAGTYMVAAAATRGDVTVTDVVPEHLEAVGAKLAEAGAAVIASEDSVRVAMGDRPEPICIKSMPYPGFPTDLQAPMAALLTVGRGTSVVTENIFNNRFRYVDELNRMGAQISVDGRTAIIRGVSELTGARVSAPDLRAGAALVVAGLAARGETVIDGVEHITRGYDSLAERMASCGALISHTVDAPEAASSDS
ncbi:MAG TPA: UDP-N-acetylglucosamine 1-carboxyvinyltransferase [Bacillota bacterium]|nr:UDP-N-acetylglucosamine 1-carboxyvinyltransferase [Bacillota bacterium]